MRPGDTLLHPICSASKFTFLDKTRAVTRSVRVTVLIPASRLTTGAKAATKRRLQFLLLPNLPDLHSAHNSPSPRTTIWCTAGASSWHQRTRA